MTEDLHGDLQQQKSCCFFAVLRFSLDGLSSANNGDRGCFGVRTPALWFI
jgi:hypothetical protein